jgi:hypothetical protein
VIDADLEERMNLLQLARDILETSISIVVSEIAKERRKPEPSEAIINAKSSERARLAQLSKSLNLDNRSELEEIVAIYSPRNREHLER